MERYAIYALIALLVSGGIGFAGYQRGYKSATDSAKVDLAGHIERAATEARKVALQDAEVLQDGDTKRERIRTVYRERERELATMAPLDCNSCRLSPPAIGLLNDALAGSDAKPAYPNPNPVPGPVNPPTGGRNFRSLDGLVDRDQLVL